MYHNCISNIKKMSKLFTYYVNSVLYAVNIW